MARLEIVRDSPAERRGPRLRPIALSLDGGAWLRVTADELAELGLVAGMELDEPRRGAVELALARTRARLFVVRSLTARAQSVAEIEAKLAAREVPRDVAREAVELALGYGYLDDAALAAQLARGHRSRGYGRRRAEQALGARGLPRELAQTAIDDAYGDGDEVAQAVAALGRRSFGEGDPARRKAAAFLARRGFSHSAAWSAVHARERNAAENDGL